MGCCLPYGIIQCYLPPDTSQRTPPNPSHAGWYSIYLPPRDGKLSWPSWLDSAPAGRQTSDLSITSPTPNCCTTKTTVSLIVCYPTVRYSPLEQCTNDQYENNRNINNTNINTSLYKQLKTTINKTVIGWQLKSNRTWQNMVHTYWELAHIHMVVRAVARHLH